jgi:hypothetical protein
VSLQFAVVHEAPADFQTATELADRVLVESFDWMEEDLIEHQRTWIRESSGAPLTWKRIKQSAFVPLLFPTGLVRVLHRGRTDRRLSLLIGTGQGNTRLPFQRGDRAQEGRHLEDRLDDLFHTPSADVLTAAQIRHHCGQALIESLTKRTDPPPTPH